MASTVLLGSEDQPSQVRRDLFGQLSGQERDRFRRYLFTKDRDLFLLVHGLLRNLLTAYCPEARPWEWEFTLGDFGKPRLAKDAGLQFSLSHAGQRAAILMTRSVPCGVDIEPLREVPQCLEISKRFFAAGEHRAVTASDQPHRRFLEFWTAKEACAKTVGLGLNLDFGTFDLSTDTEILYLPGTGIEPARRHCVYRQGFIRKGYSVAVAFLEEKTALSVFEPDTMLFGGGSLLPLSSSPSRPFSLNLSP